MRLCLHTDSTTMGSSATKQFKTLDLSTTVAPPLSVDMCVNKAIPPVNDLTHFSAYVTQSWPHAMEVKGENGAVLLSTTAEPTGRVTMLHDARGGVVAVSKNKSKDFKHATAIVYRTEPTYRGQSSTDSCPHSRAPLFAFGLIRVKLGFQNKCTYGIFRDGDDVVPIYRGSVVPGSKRKVCGAADVGGR